MRKILTDATIFVTMGLMSVGVLAWTSAQASEMRYQLEESRGMEMMMGKVNLRFSGDIAYGMFILDNDDLVVGATTREYTSFSVKNMDSHISFTAALPFDNGLVSGYRASVDADGIFDENYIFVDGGFGVMLFGVANNVSDFYHVSVPDFTPGNNIDDPNVYNIDRISTNHTGGADSLSTLIIYDEESFRVNYASPSLSGITALFSFTPEPGARGYNGFGAGTKGDKVTDAITLAVHYEMEQPIFGVTGGLIISYMTADGPKGDKDPSIVSLGAQMKWRDFTFGVGYKTAEDMGRRASDNRYIPELTVWTVGGSYERGPWIVGFGYRSSELDALPMAGAANAVTKKEHTALLLGASYDLGAGMKSGVSIEVLNDEDKDATTQDLDAFSFGLSLALSF